MFIGNHNLDLSSYIIAELSANHVNNLNIVLKTIEAAKNCGANAIKLQTFTADSMTLNIDSPLFMGDLKGPWAGRRLYELYEEAALPYDWYDEIFKLAKELKIHCFSSPFDLESTDYISNYNPPAYKIASFEITDIPLIEYVAAKGKPIIISTGVAELEDIELAIEACKKVNNEEICILKCTSKYPTPFKDVNLQTMKDLKERFGVHVGVSDHTMGYIVPVMSTVMGGRIIEKHFTLDRNLGGPDASFSMTPNEFQEMITAVRATEAAMGKVEYTVSENDKKRRRSLYSTKIIKKGDVIAMDNVKSIRPGYGMHPKYLLSIIGKKANKTIAAGTPLTLELISN